MATATGTPTNSATSAATATQAVLHTPRRVRPGPRAPPAESSGAPGKAVIDHVAAGGSNTSRSPWRGDVEVGVGVGVGAPTRTDSNVSVQPARAIAATPGGPHAQCACARAHLAPFVVRPA